MYIVRSGAVHPSPVGVNRPPVDPLGQKHIGMGVLLYGAAPINPR